MTVRQSVGLSHVVAGAVGALVALWFTGWLAAQFTHRPTQPTSINWQQLVWHVEIGVGSSGYPSRCRFFGVNALPDHVLAVAVAGETPSEGALMSGNFAGFGLRKVRNDSTGSVITVNVVYHVDDLQAVVDELHRRCFKG